MMAGKPLVIGVPVSTAGMTLGRSVSPVDLVCLSGRCPLQEASP